MYTDSATPEDLDVLRGYLREYRPVAIGEIGLDFFHRAARRARQEYFFAAQLKLAREFDLPVLLHIRRAQRHRPQTPAPILWGRRPFD